MPTYISLNNFTREGLRGTREGARKREMGKQVAASMNIVWKGSYLTLGAYDLVLIFEAPDDETAARFALGGAMQGDFTTQTLRAFDEAEADRLISGIPTAPAG